MQRPPTQPKMLRSLRILLPARQRAKTAAEMKLATTALATTERGTQMGDATKALGEMQTAEMKLATTVLGMKERGKILIIGSRKEMTTATARGAVYSY